MHAAAIAQGREVFGRMKDVTVMDKEETIMKGVIGQVAADTEMSLEETITNMRESTIIGKRRHDYRDRLMSYKQKKSNI